MNFTSDLTQEITITRGELIKFVTYIGMLSFYGCSCQDCCLRASAAAEDMISGEHPTALYNANDQIDALLEAGCKVPPGGLW